MAGLLFYAQFINDDFGLIHIRLHKKSVHRWRNAKITSLPVLYL